MQNFNRCVGSYFAEFFNSLEGIVTISNQEFIGFLNGSTGSSVLPTKIRFCLWIFGKITILLSGGRRIYFFSARVNHRHHTDEGG